MDSKLRQRRSAGNASANGSGNKSSSSSSSRARANTGGMWRFYTDDSPGIKIGPVPVLVISLVFIASVFMLHIWMTARSRITERVKSVVSMQSIRTMRESSLRGINKMIMSNMNRACNQQPAPRSSSSSIQHFSPLTTTIQVGLLTSLILAISIQSNVTFCLEQDAQLLQPVADLAKGAIKTATLGVPLEFHMNISGFAKNFAYFTWRTRFPITMPKGFTTKVQDFYNRIRARVQASEVKDIERKSLANLRVDLDDIVDAIVEQVRSSKDGLYTDYLQTRVHGVPIEDACTRVGIQLKAYGVDLTNYRNIAGAVLGIPVMPTVASALVGVGSYAPTTFRQITNFTSANLPLTHSTLFNRIPSALNTVSSSVNNNLQQQTIPVINQVVSPFSSLLGQTLSLGTNALGQLAGGLPSANGMQQQPNIIAGQA